jgi:hypothetical protein
MPRRLAAVSSLIVIAAFVIWCSPISLAQTPSPRVPTARLIAAATVTLPSEADSNSPAVWERVDGRLRLFMFTSIDGESRRSDGTDVARLTSRGPVQFENHPGAGVWFEAIVPDVDGTWYGYYHNEWPADICNDPGRTIPRIGAARSSDFGATWYNLGVVLESPPGTYDCGSTNQYFVGGVGDFSVMLDQESQYLYLFFSQYANRESAQGVSVARLAWADRDAPAGKASVWWRNQTWIPARAIRTRSGERHIYSAGGPIYRANENWHSAGVDAFWGPSVHWNTYLGQYVMLLNRARDAAWTQEGTYVAFTPTLNDPGTWSIPQRLTTGGRWYPQVLGLEVGVGTDRIAGERPRFFMSGRSDHLIQFSR